MTEFGNDRDIVEGSEGKNDEIVEDGCHAHQPVCAHTNHTHKSLLNDSFKCLF